MEGWKKTQQLGLEEITKGKTSAAVWWEERVREDWLVNREAGRKRFQQVGVVEGVENGYLADLGVVEGEDNRLLYMRKEGKQQ